MTWARGAEAAGAKGDLAQDPLGRSLWLTAWTAAAVQSMVEPGEPLVHFPQGGDRLSRKKMPESRPGVRPLQTFTGWSVEQGSVQRTPATIWRAPF